jgi:Ni/Fe-hydrogenase subunit HybB-like protein
MESTVVYNVFFNLAWGVPIATYFLLTGVSAGAFIISTLAYVFGMKKYKPVGLLALLTAIIVLLLGPTILILDLNQPLRFFHMVLPMYWHLSSPMSWGIILLTTYPINCLIYGYYIVKGDEKKTKFFGRIGIPLAILVHGYTGLIIGLVQGKALWHTSLMIALFLASAMVSGVALLNLILIVKRKFFGGFMNKYFPNATDELIIDLGRLNLWLIVLDMSLIGSELITLRYGGVEEAADLGILLFGLYRYLFLGNEILMGAIIPLIILIIPRTRTSIPWITFASILIVNGIWAMRNMVVYAGSTMQLYF